MRKSSKPLSEKHRQKISEAIQRRVKLGIHKMPNNLGRIFSETHRKNLSKAINRRVSLGIHKHPDTTGRVPSMEERRKISETKKRLYAEGKIKPTAYWTGKKHSAMSIAMKGRPSPKKGIKLEEQIKKKISNSKKLYFQNGGKIWNKGKKSLYPSWNKGRKCPEWSGEKNQNWKGGITSEMEKIRKSIELKNWHRAVFNRDNYKCQSCGEGGKDIQAHHINEFSRFPKLRFDVNNGVTLHKDCHRHIHQMERMNGIESNQLKEGFL